MKIYIYFINIFRTKVLEKNFKSVLCPKRLPLPRKAACIRDRNRHVSRRDYVATVNPGSLACSECSESDGLTRTLRIRNFNVYVCVNFC
jgi:hypothetical protein